MRLCLCRLRLRLRLRRWRKVTASMSDAPENIALPARALARAQHSWLQGARARLLRRADIANRRRIVELGAGWGDVAEELLRRSCGWVIALDWQPAQPAGDAGSFQLPSAADRSVHWLQAAAEELPLPDASCDLVFAQCVCLWIKRLADAVAEAARVLEPGGVFAAIEPDYGGLMAHPEEAGLPTVWIDALSRAGADPFVGRRLPAALQAAGLEAEVLFLDRLEAPQAARFDLLEELPLTDQDRRQLARARSASASSPPPVVHLPFWLVLGTKR